MPERTTGLILDPAGNPATVPTLILDADAVRIMRQYKKKVLLPYGLIEALYCNECWENNLAHGCEAHVSDSQILIKCRCKLRFYQGPTY